MRLTDLNPILREHGYLEFDCPLGHPHRICIPIDTQIVPRAWVRSGDYPETLTLQPSIHAHKATPNDETLSGDAYEKAAECGWHGFITRGRVATV